MQHFTRHKPFSQKKPHPPRPHNEEFTGYCIVNQSHVSRQNMPAHQTPLTDTYTFSSSHLLLPCTRSNEFTKMQLINLFKKRTDM